MLIEGVSLFCFRFVFLIVRIGAFVCVTKMDSCIMKIALFTVHAKMSKEILVVELFS